MEKVEITIDDDKYYIYKYKVLDSSFIVVSENVKSLVLKQYYKDLIIERLNKDDLIRLIHESKELGAYNISIKSIEHLFRINREDSTLIKRYLAMLASSYRLLFMPEKTINVVEYYLKKDKTFATKYLLTSLAAAYCDVKKYDQALRCCNYAYKLKGGSDGTMDELSLVYERIKKENV